MGTFPDGWTLPDTGVQRGTLSTMDGDILTPSLPAIGSVNITSITSEDFHCLFLLVYNVTASFPELKFHVPMKSTNCMSLKNSACTWAPVQNPKWRMSFGLFLSRLVIVENIKVFTKL